MNSNTNTPGGKQTPGTNKLLEVCDLSVGFHTDNGPIHVLEKINYSISHGETIGLVGESGCGKSVSVMTLMGLLPSPPSFVDSGSIFFMGEDLLRKSDKEMMAVRGKEIGMIFQEPMTSLNPTFSIGWQLAEPLITHLHMSKQEARKECLRLLDMVGIGGGEKRLEQYPHELSGGLRQRIMIAMALACRPKLLIADEPTTALDVTIQAQILDLLADLQEELGMSILMITHDLGVVMETCSYVNIMYAGRIVEHGSIEDIFQTPAHPYTKGLLASIPRLSKTQKWLPTIPGVVPSPMEREHGCYFAERCNERNDRCFKIAPPTKPLKSDGNSIEHCVACWNYEK